MKIEFRNGTLGVLTLMMVACDTGPRSTTTDSRTFSSFEQKKEFLERYLKFRRSYESLNYLIQFRNGGQFPPSPSEWNIRVVATVPASEIDQWISGMTATSSPNTKWLSEIAEAPSDLSAFEWYADFKKLVGIDRQRRIVLYRIYTQ